MPRETRQHGVPCPLVIAKAGSLGGDFKATSLALNLVGQGSQCLSTSTGYEMHDASLPTQEPIEFLEYQCEHGGVHPLLWHPLFGLLVCNGHLPFQLWNHCIGYAPC